MTDTANLGLPCIEGSQAQKHVTHNDALRILDTLVQLAVLDRDLTTPPGSPSEGQRWIVKTGATGAWAGHSNAVAAWQDGAWQFSTPQTCWCVYVVDEGTLLVWNGAAWGDFFSTVTSIQNLALLGIGTTADTTNRLSAKLNNALFVAQTVAEGGDGNLRYKLSKESSSKTLSFLLQDNYSGRAEIGLTGDDDFHFKVSPDGSAWVDALRLDKTTGLMTHVDGVVPRTLSVQRGGDTNDSSSGSGAYHDHSLTYTIPANFLTQGRALRITTHWRYTSGSAVPVLDIQLKTGSTVLAHFTPSGQIASKTNFQHAIQWILQAVDAPGAAANVEAVQIGTPHNLGNIVVDSDVAMPVALATNGALTLKVATQWATAGTGTNTLKLSQFIVEALN